MRYWVTNCTASELEYLDMAFLIKFCKADIFKKFLFEVIRMKIKAASLCCMEFSFVAKLLFFVCWYILIAHEKLCLIFNLIIRKSRVGTRCEIDLR